VLLYDLRFILAVPIARYRQFHIALAAGNGFLVAAVASVAWSNPVEIGAVVQKNSLLKSFEEISGVFQTMMNTSCEAVIEITLENLCELDINVTDVRLCLMRVREQNAAQTEGLLVPAWAFYGHNRNKSGWRSTLFPGSRIA
jgi:hypothetical protein